MARRETLVRRARVPPWFWGVAMLHGALGAAAVAYPIVTWRWWLAGRAFDGVYVLVCVAVVLHWALLSGECIMSVLEKKAFYEDYRMGSCPMHQWFYEHLPLSMVVRFAVVFFGVWMCGLLAVVLRNVKVGRQRLSICAPMGPGRPTLRLLISWVVDRRAAA